MGDRENENLSKSQIFKYICDNPKGVKRRPIQKFMLKKSTIGEGSVNKYLIFFVNKKIFDTNNRPEPGKKHSGRENIYTLSGDAKAIITYMFETFDHDRKQLLQVFYSPGIRDLIAKITRENTDFDFGVWALFKKSLAIEELKYKYPFPDSTHLEGVASLHEGMLVSPSLLRGAVMKYEPPMLSVFEWIFSSDFALRLSGKYFLDGFLILRFLSYYMLDMAKYPDQVNILEKDLQREEVISYIKTAWPDEAYPLEKLHQFANFIRENEQKDSPFKKLNPFM